MKEYYICTNCDKEISTEDIKHNLLCITGVCPDCGSYNVDYFDEENDKRGNM